MEESKTSYVPLVALAATFLIVGVAIWLISRDRGGESAARRDTGAEERKAMQSPPPAAPSQPVVVHGAADELSQLVSGEQLTPEEKLQGVGQLLYTYRQGLGGLPSGQNEDVVAALLGGNEKHTALLRGDCPAIRNGQLVDTWDTPYWFHSVSSRQMEVRSAGPDRQLFTADDLILE